MMIEEYRWILMRHNDSMFKRISKYCDFMGILMLVKVKGFEKYGRFLKHQFKDILYMGLSTKNRIDYWSVITRLKTKKAKYKSVYLNYSKRVSNYEADIILDIARTYPLLDFFKPGNEGYNQLLNILKAVSHVFPKVG